MQLRGVSLGYEIPHAVVISPTAAAVSPGLSIVAVAPTSKIKKTPKVDVKVILNNINLDIDQNSKIAILGKLSTRIVSEKLASVLTYHYLFYFWSRKERLWQVYFASTFN